MTSTATLPFPPRKQAPAAGLFGALRIAQPADAPLAANERERREFVDDYLSGTHTHPLRDGLQGEEPDRR